MAKESDHTSWYRFYPADFTSDEAWPYMTDAERGVYLSLLIGCYSNGNSLDYDLDRLAMMCNSAPETVEKVIKMKFVKRAHRRKNCFGTKFYIKHKRVETEIKRAKSRVSACKKAANTRWQNNANAYPDAYSDVSATQCNKKERKKDQKEKKEYLKKIYKKKPEDFKKSLEKWSARRGIPPDAVPERECDQLLELLALMPAVQLCEIIESDVFALTPKSLVVEWSKQRKPEKPTLTEQYLAYQRQKKPEGGADH